MNFCTRHHVTHDVRFLGGYIYRERERERENIEFVCVCVCVCCEHHMAKFFVCVCTQELCSTQGHSFFSKIHTHPSTFFHVVKWQRGKSYMSE